MKHVWRFGERTGKNVVIVCTGCGVAIETTLLRFNDLEDPEGYLAGDCE